MNVLHKRWSRLECEALEDRVTPATLTWIGAVDGLWSHAGNWTTTDVTHPVPQNGDAVVLPAGAQNQTQTDDLDLSLTSLTIGAIGYTLSGHPISLGNLTVSLPAGTSGGGDQILDDLAFVVTNPGDVAIIDLGNNNESLYLYGNVVIAGAGTVVVTSAGNGAGLFADTSLTVLATATLIVQDSVVGLYGSAGVYGKLFVGSSSGAAAVTIAAGTTLGDLGTVQVSETSQLYVGGVLDVEPSNGTFGLLTMYGLVLVESTGSLYSDGRIDNVSGELYIAGLAVIEGSSLFDQQTGTAFTVVAGGGELYVAGDMVDNNGSQLYVFGQVQVANNHNDGLGVYIYDSTITIETGGALYAYGLVAIEPDSALYDYGTLYLASGGYLYNADLFVVERGGVLYDFGTFYMAPGGTYYNFGQQVGSGQ